MSLKVTRGHQLATDPRIALRRPAHGKRTRSSDKILSHRCIQFYLLDIAGDKNLSATKNVQASDQPPIWIMTAEVQETNLAGSDAGTLLTIS
jgi:hypothetical protein